MADQSTIVEIPLTSTTRAVTIPFDYLTRSAVVLTVKQTEDVTFEKTLKLTDDYRFTGTSQVTLNGDYSSFGDLLEVKRHTPATGLVNFKDGSVLTANSLNIAQLQAVHIAEEGRFEITTEIREATADAQRFAQASAASASDSLTYRNATQRIWDGILDSIQSAGDAGTLGYLATPVGLSAIGAFISFDSMRLTKPQHEGQRVKLESYFEGKYLGGGEFVGHLTTAVDDGGTIASGPSHHWKRTDDKSAINVTHFGALMDGVTDDIEALKKMHAWSVKIDATFGPGIHIPAGIIALSSMDLGTAEIPAFKVKGPNVEFGVVPELKVVPVSLTSLTPMFKFKARRMEISGMALYGSGSKQPWFVNTVTRGSYVRIKSIVCRSTAGRVFQMIDTIDCKIDQIYTYSCTAGIVWVTWSNENPGVWDHPTAIELTNANFTSQKGEFAFSAIRCGQSLMRNVWFTACERGFDVSQGGWVFDTVIAEGPTAGGVNFAGRAKLTETACRFAQGATVGREPTDSGYDPSMDTGGDVGTGSMPSWVTNAMDQGRTQINTAGLIQNNGFSKGYELPLPTMRFLNSTGNEQWVHIGKVICNNTLGATFELELQGANGYDNIGTSTNHPGSTGFGGGRALIRGQLKYPQASTTAIQLTWHGEGACPIKEVRYVHAWQNFDVYVRVGAFTRVIGAFLRGDGVGRDRSGAPFYFREGTGVVDISTITNLAQAHAVWSINGGVYGSSGGHGIGMDLDSGKLLLASPEEGQNAALFLPLKNNYVDRYVPLQDTKDSIRLPRYTKATLPRADANPYGLILVTDAGAGSGAVTRFRLAFSTGENWIDISANSNLGPGTAS